MPVNASKSLRPLYTHPIGSLPRPAVVRDLLSQRAKIDTDTFHHRMDALVRFAITLQEQAGLDVVSDGEWRRSHYIGEWLSRIGGFERVRPIEHQGQTLMTEVVVRRMAGGEPAFARDARFLVNNTSRPAKVALPSPFLIAVRYWHPDYSTDAYPTFDAFLDHLAELLAIEAQAVNAQGVAILQLDDPALTYFCDRRLIEGEAVHDERLRRQWDIDRQLPRAVDAINRVVENLKCEVHLHCCHSVHRRRSDVEGDYKPILPRLAAANIDCVNLEFAYQNTGAADDLRELPKQIGVGMGVLDVRSERLQTVEEIEALIEAGLRELPPERIAINPDCGFAPDAGEPPTIDEAFEKLSRLCQAAHNVRQRLGAMPST